MAQKLRLRSRPKVREADSIISPDIRDFSHYPQNVLEAALRILEARKERNRVK